MWIVVDKRSARAKKILPRGFVLWGWDADPEYDEREGAEWLNLHPKKWNAHVQYACGAGTLIESLWRALGAPHSRAPRVWMR